MSFLTLPLEIRLKVYSYVFGHGNQVIEANDAGTLWGSQPEERSAQLLYVSKAIRKEATPIFYDQTVIKISRNLGALESLNRESKESRALTRDVRHLTVDIDPIWWEQVDSSSAIASLAAKNLANVQDITLSCFAFDWNTSWRVADMGYENRYTYDDLLPGMRTLAATMLATHNLTELREESIPKRKLVMRIFRVKSEGIDDKVTKFHQTR